MDLKPLHVLSPCTTIKQIGIKYFLWPSRGRVIVRPMTPATKVGQHPSPLRLPPPLLLTNSNKKFKRRCVVNWYAECSKIDWSEEKVKPERPRQKRVKPKPRRIVLASTDTVGTVDLLRYGWDRHYRGREHGESVRQE